METALLIIHVLVSILIVLFVMIQSGKGRDMGAAFGASTGTSNSVFGASGAGNFLTKATTWLAVAFAITSLSITVFQARSNKSSIFDTGVVPTTTTTPATPADAVTPATTPTEEKK